jgi:hypothetical protein
MVHHAYINTLNGVNPLPGSSTPSTGSAKAKRSARGIETEGLVLEATLATRLVIPTVLETPLVGRRVAERRGLPTRTLLRHLLPDRKVQVSRLGIPELVRPVKLLTLLS